MDQIRVQLRSRLRRALFAGGALVCVGAYLTLATESYVASRLAAQPELSNLQRAIALEPANAEYRELLGRYLALSLTSLDEAIRSYRTAVQLNPYAARYWLDLAAAYGVEDRGREQAEAVEKAVEADPTTPHVAWEAGNIFLVQGEREKALREFRVVLNNDPETVDATLLLCWRATGDADLMLDQAVPERSDLYFSFLRLLIAKERTADAEKVWNRLIALKQPFAVPLAFPYFRFLLDEKEVAAAQTAWSQLATLNPSLARYLASPENLIVNGGFEENLLNGGFDWWYVSNPHARLAIDTSKFHSGTRSLSVFFDGPSVAEAGITELVPVKADTEYEFSAEYRTDELESASGPRFALIDAYSHASYVVTEDLLGTNPWRLVQARFRTGPASSLLALKIIRQPVEPLIRGKLWIDDLKLVERENQN